MNVNWREKLLPDSRNVKWRKKRHEKEKGNVKWGKKTHKKGERECKVGIEEA